MRLKSTSKIKLGEREVELILDMNVLCEIETSLDVNIMTQPEFFESLGFVQLRGMLWAMMYKEQPRPTLEEVGEMLSETSMDEIGTAIGNLFSADSEKSTEKATKKGKASDPTKD
jgi:hypothetical protein